MVKGIQKFSRCENCHFHHYWEQHDATLCMKDTKHIKHVTWDYFCPHWEDMCEYINSAEEAMHCGQRWNMAPLAKHKPYYVVR